MKPILIAEIAKEHDGDIEKAKELIIEAKVSGFDKVKFQAYDVDDINPDHSNYTKYKKCHLNIAKLKTLKEYSDKLNIDFYCSVFSSSLILELAKFTDEIKVPSTFLSNSQFVIDCMRNFDKVHLSTGMHTKSDIHAYYTKYTSMQDIFKCDLSMYHCVSEYPTDLNKAKLSRLQDPWIDYCGYSDHTKGTDAILVAWLMGARYIEKHFSIKEDAKEWCTTPKEMELLFSNINELDIILEDKEMGDAEKENFEFYKKEFNDLSPFRK